MLNKIFYKKYTAARPFTSKIISPPTFQTVLEIKTIFVAVRGVEYSDFFVYLVK